MYLRFSEKTGKSKKTKGIWKTMYDASKVFSENRENTENRGYLGEVMLLKVFSENRENTENKGYLGIQCIMLLKVF